MTVFEDALAAHKEKRGKISITPLLPCNTKESLSIAYTPGVAEPCRKIKDDPTAVNIYTRRWNMVGIVSDGSAVLGLGDIGARAAMPVMEGKACLFKSFGGVDAFPICLDTNDVDEIVRTVKLLEPTFGGINLEDISAPRCFEIEEKLKEICDIPIFHDDQHGTAIAVMSAMINALKVVNKTIDNIRVVTLGAGAAATAVIKLLLKMGVKDAIMVDKTGIIYDGRYNLNDAKKEIAKVTNPNMVKGGIAEALKGADVFIGLSGPNLVSKDMVRSMNRDAIVMSMANPTPEIMPEDAKAAGAKVVCTGRSDFPNQVNNVLAFPGLFRGALDVAASDINEEMKIAACYGIASIIRDEELSEDYVIPLTFDSRVAPAVAYAVAKAAIDSGVANNDMTPDEVMEHCIKLASI